MVTPYEFKSRFPHHEKTPFVDRQKAVFSTMCSATADRDVCFASDVHFVRDARLRHVSGTHHITLRHSSNISLFAEQTASLAPTAHTSLDNFTFLCYTEKKKKRSTKFKLKNYEFAGRVGSIDNGLFIHAIVPRHVETVVLMTKKSTNRDLCEEKRYDTFGKNRFN